VAALHQVVWRLRLEQYRGRDEPIPSEQVGELQIRELVSDGETGDYLACLSRCPSGTPTWAELTDVPIAEVGPWGLVHAALDKLVPFARHRSAGEEGS